MREFARDVVPDTRVDYEKVIRQVKEGSSYEERDQNEENRIWRSLVAVFLL